MNKEILKPVTDLLLSIPVVNLLIIPTVILALDNI
jgi:uncharacterized protein involved in cysteine biosynthesis